MARDERMKRYQEAGAEFVEAARARAEEFLRELGSLGEAAGRSAGANVDDLRSAGKRGTDQLVDVIRREVTAQLSSLGLATRDDLRALERRVEELTATVASEPGGTTAAAKGSGRKATAAKASSRPRAAKATAGKAVTAKATTSKATTAKASTAKASTAKATTAKAAAKRSSAKSAAVKAAASPPTKRAPSKAPAKRAGGSS